MVPASTNAVFTDRVADFCNFGDRLARRRALDRVSQANTMVALLQESSSVWDVFQMESPKPAAAILEGSRRSPAVDSGSNDASSDTESLFGPPKPVVMKILDSVLEPEVVVPNLRAGRELCTAFAALDEVDLPIDV